jgi:hypothetical protein
MQQSDFQSLILRGLAENSVEPRLGGAHHFLVPSVRRLCPSDDQPSHKEVQEAVWTLIARGLAFLDMAAQSPEDWRVTLTEVGTAAARDEVIHPDEASYRSQFYSDVPAMAPMV